MLKELFVSDVRVKILKLTFTKPDKNYHVRALVRSVGAEINAVRRELLNLVNIGLLRNRQSGNRIYYTANVNSIYYPELLSLIAKEDGLGSDIIKQQKRLGNVKYAVLSKSFLRGRSSTALDVDLFIVGDINLNVLSEIIKKEEDKAGREINYTVMDEEDFMFRKRKNDAFVAKVLSQSRSMLIGDEEEFCSVF